MIDLDAIAAEELAKRTPPVPCWLCGLPEREWVEKARTKGLSIPVIIATLERAGVNGATRHRISNHMATHVR